MNDNEKDGGDSNRCILTGTFLRNERNLSHKRAKWTLNILLSSFQRILIYMISNENKSTEIIKY